MDFKSKQKTLFQRQKILRDNATPSELRVCRLLDSLGIRYLFQKWFIAGDYYCIVDFYFPRPLKTVLEIDGPYHQSEKMKKKDYAREMYLKSRGIRIVRITNEEVERLNENQLKKIIGIQ